MKGINPNRLYLFLFFISFFSNNIFSQVTIGTRETPAQGSLLQLKNIRGVTDGSKNADKGLGMPRVSINALDKLQLGDADELTDKAAHIGLLVYNVNVIETAENRVCEGLHVWNGTAWLPLVPYSEVSAPNPGNPTVPTIINVEKEILSKELYNDPVNYPIGPLGTYTDVRGPNNEETNNYYMARFYAAKVKEKVITTYQGQSAYACNPATTRSGAIWTEEEEIERIEDGVWMTQNMRTRFAPNAESTPIPFDDYTIGDGYNLAYWKYPGAEPMEEVQQGPDEEGLLYNWAAATVGADGKHGRGGETGKELVGQSDCREERALWYEPVQGICPEGWHLPSMKDYDMLRDAVIADPLLYCTEANLPTEMEIGRAFKHPSTAHNTGHSGVSKEAWEGGFAAYLTNGWTGSTHEYGYAVHFWNSSNIAASAYCIVGGQYALYAEDSYFGFNFQYRYVGNAVRCMKY